MKYQLGLSGEGITSRVSNRFDGVGLLRAEYLCRKLNKYVTLSESRSYIRDYVEKIAELFAPDPVWYRTTDIETAEINVLEGADHVIEEKTTMLGCRGIRRARLFPEAFMLELGVIAELAARHPNVNILAPFISDPSELVFFKDCLAKVGFRNKVGIMAEIPSSVLCLDEFLKLGVDQVTIGLNDLSSLALGAYRGSELQQCLHPALKRLLIHAREATLDHPVTLAVAGYIDRELIEFVDDLGFDYAVVQYSKLEEVFGPEFAGLPYQENLDEIKRRRREIIQDRYERLAVEKWQNRQSKQRSSDRSSETQEHSATGGYFRKFAAALRRETEACLEGLGADTLLAEITDFERTCQLITAEPNYDEWLGLCRTCRRLLHRKASLANELSYVAHPYDSMEEFWQDADAQERGESRYTYWDTYEHGRRRQLESLLARAYDSSSALLLNSGMSAIAVAIGMLNLRVGSRILTGERCYFETSDYLDRFVRQTGVEVIRVPVDQPEIIASALNKLRPDLAIFETITNVATVPIAHGFNDWLEASPETFFLIDNSVQSHLTRWFDILPESPRLLVAESATKYLAEECMAGALYGHAEAIDRARNFARSTGQQLQEKAFSYFAEASIELISQKLNWHSRNVAAVIDELRPHADLFEFVRALDANFNDEPELRPIFKHGRGALIFLALRPRKSSGNSLGQLHNQLLQRWRAAAIDAGLGLQIRAGFGWNQTSARAYDSGRLNQPDAPCFVRISMGTEPMPVARLLARLLIQAALEIAENEPAGAMI